MLISIIKVFLYNFCFLSLQIVFLEQPVLLRVLLPERVNLFEGEALQFLLLHHQLLLLVFLELVLAAYLGFFVDELPLFLHPLHEQGSTVLALSLPTCDVILPLLLLLFHLFLNFLAVLVVAFQGLKLEPLVLCVSLALDALQPRKLVPGNAALNLLPLLISPVSSLKLEIDLFQLATYILLVPLFLFVVPTFEQVWVLVELGLQLVV